MRRYPAPGVTKHGFYELVRGEIPMMWLEAHDGSIVFDLMGGRSIPDRTCPESVQLPRDGIRGLIPPWRSVDQKGASQDGVTWVDSLYDPCEVALTVFASGRDRTHVRTVVRDLIASIDAKKVAKLHFWTHEMGHWWADLRWFKTPPDANQVASRRRHRMTLVLRADDAFWRSDASTDSWAPSYVAVEDKFSLTQTSPTATMLGTKWPLFYYGPGAGNITADGSKVVWNDQAGWATGDRAVIIGPYKDFSTLSDKQVISMWTGNRPQMSLDNTANNEIWGRMGRNLDGTWNGYGIRLRIGSAGVQLSRFTGWTTTTISVNNEDVYSSPRRFTWDNNEWFHIPGLAKADFPADQSVYAMADNTGTARNMWFDCRHMGANVELRNRSGGPLTFKAGDRFRTFKRTDMARKLIAPLKIKGEKWTLVCGSEDNPRKFTVMRNDTEMFWHVEDGTESALGSSYRGVGFGMGAAGSVNQQASPSTVKAFAAGDNVTIAQEGYLRRVNVGDQPMYDKLTVFGPGRFKFWVGPDAGANDYVEFGPLLPSQVVQIDTDPRRRSVQDLTTTPPSPQELKQWQKALDTYLDLGGEGIPLVAQIKSKFGILPPQGNLYSLLKGRWSDKGAIPHRSPGDPVKTYFVKVAVDDGGPTSKVVASGVPKRRYPL